MRLLPVLWPMAVLLAVALVLIIWSSQRSGRPAAWLAEDKNNLAQTVRRLAVVPTENPQISEISNPDDYKTEAFRSLLERGDLLLAYPEGGKQLVFRPAQNKVVYVGDLKAAVIRQPAKIEVEIRNGSTNLGAAAALAKILAQDQSLSILDINQAKDNAYQQTMLIDLSGGQYVSTGSKIAKDLEAQELKALPSGEEPSKADLLIIVGNNRQQ